MRLDRLFSLIMPYHDNPGMLNRQYISYIGATPAEADQIEIVICDDASAEPMPTPEMFYRVGAFPRVRLFRIPPPHIPWSHRVATNIAAAESRGQWLLVTDIDHVVPLATWRWLFGISDTLRRDRAYQFQRVNADGSVYTPHPDTWLFHRSMWQTICGYDERYRGHYGQNYPFIERVRAYATIETLPCSVVRYSRDDIPDASERVLTRKTPEAKAAIGALRRHFKANGSFLEDTRGSAHYERVYP